ncbi:MAG: S8/S53 family peptidase [Alphaproteobacteria bacterium]|nr:S8/S53 family peptidase [Alphaproteobacteria bacterium]
MDLLKSLICLFNLKEYRKKVALRSHEDYSVFNYVFDPREITDATTARRELDIRTRDCFSMDLSECLPELITYDSETVFPKNPQKMIKDFNPKEIMERHKNPGLGVRQLHKEGFTGKGVSVAIIDQTLSPHQEYMKNLVSYKEFGYEGLDFLKGSMHGSAVSSILVGRTCGVAPDAKLYYYAANNKKPNGELTSKNHAKALNDILDLNETLPDGEKIQAVSVSWGRMDECDGAEEWNNTLERAKKAGVCVISSNLRQDYGLHFIGLGRKNNADPDDVNSYGHGYFIQMVYPNSLAVPMDNRTLASPQSKNGYVHYANGGWSWAIPFYTGLFLLARQADKNITLEDFHRKALDTGFKRADVPALIAQPERLIEAIQNERLLKSELTINQAKNIKNPGR